MALLSTGLSELKAASSGSKFFTAEWKNVARNWVNYMSALKEMIDEEENAETLKNMKVVEKQVMAAKAVLQKLSVHGMLHLETQQAYCSQMQFLVSDPVAPSPFPVYFVQQMHAQVVEKSWPADVFWRELHDEGLLRLIPGSDIEKFQVEALSSKIIAICQQDEDTSVEEGLVQVASLELPLIKSEVVQAEVSDLLAVAEVGGSKFSWGFTLPEQPGAAATKLGHALERFRSRHAHAALTSYPKGRRILQTANDRLVELKALQERISKLHAEVHGPWTDALVGALNEIVLKHMHMYGGQEIVRSVVTAERVGKLFEEMCSTLSAEMTEMDITAKSRSKALRDAPALHSLHESTADYAAMYAVVHDIHQIKYMIASDSALNFEESLFFLDFLADYGKDVDCLLFHRKLMELDSVVGESLRLWIDAAKSSPKAAACEQTCKASAAPVLESAKLAVDNTFKNTVKMPADLTAWSEFDIAGGLGSAISACRRMSGQKLVVAELNFLGFFGQMCKSYSLFKRERDSIVQKKGRAVSDHAIKQLCGALADVQRFKDFNVAFQAQVDDNDSQVVVVVLVS